MKEKIINRLKRYIDRKGISLNSFDKAISASNGYIGRQIRNNASVGGDVIEEISCIYPDLNLEWLITGKGEMLKNEAQRGVSIKETFPLRTDNTNDKQYVPLYSNEATAGIVEVFSDGKTVPLDYILLPNLPPVDGAVYVRGDSMDPLLKSGDIVLYKRVADLQYGIFWGEIYLIAAAINGEEHLMIKYVQKSDKAGFIKLVSHNVRHDPQEIPIKIVRAMAIVKASVRYNTM